MEIKIYKKCFMVTLALLTTGVMTLKASFEFKEAGVRGAAMGGAYTAVADDVEAIWWNPAGLRLIKGVEFTSTYTNLYGMSDLGYNNVVLVVPTLIIGTWGVGYSGFGPSEYKETDIRLSFASGLGHGFYLGTNLKNQTVDINYGGKASTFGFDVGVISNVGEKLRLAFSGININSPTLGDTVDNTAQRFLVGVQWKPQAEVSASLDFQKPIDEEMQVRFGNEFRLNENFVIRGGVQSFPVRFSVGFGVNWALFNFNYAYQTHEVLAGQHLFSLGGKFRGEGRQRAAYEGASREEERFSGKVNINTATVEDLTKLPGVGSITAKQIITYRQKAGEFRSVQELRDIYGFSRTTYDKIEKYVTVDKATDVKSSSTGRSQQQRRSEPEPEPEPESEPVKEIEKININKAGIRDIAGISGVSSLLARNIVSYRNRQESFNNWDDLLKIPGINNRVLNNIKEEAVFE